MSNEIDRLEVVVEAEASKANRSLSRLEKHIGNVADGLEKVATLSGALGHIGDIDLSGFQKASDEIDGFLGKGKKVNRNPVTPKIKGSGFEKASRNLDDIWEKYKKVGTNTDVSDMGFRELKQNAESTQRTLDRLYNRLEKKIALEGTDELGKSWDNLIYDIQKATNQLEIYENALDELRTKGIGDIPINRGDTSAVEGMPTDTPQASVGYENPLDKTPLDFGESIQEASTFEAQIKRLKAELKSLEQQGYGQYDPEYDKVARELAEVVAAQKRYNKEMRKGAEDALNYGKAEKEIKKATNGFDALFRKAKKAAKTFDKTTSSIGKFIKKLRGARKESGRGFSLPKMIGMSVLFSTVFQAIQAIKQAVVDGSNNLVQYSKAYNRSISSVVSALTYLKNAWAAAFAPIVNVVAPYLQSFIDMIATALNAVGRFFAALTGKGFAVQATKVVQDYGASLGGAAKSAGDANKAAKDLQKTIFGFDEMNILNAPSDSGGSGGGGGGGGAGALSADDMFETVEVEDSMFNIANMVKEAWAKADFTEIGAIVGRKLNDSLENIPWDNIKATSGKIAKSLATFLNGFIAASDWKLVGKTIAESLNTAIEFGYAFVTTFDWSKFGKAIGDSISGLFQNLEWSKAGKTLSDGFIGILNTLSTALEKADWTSLGKGIGEFITNIDWFGVFVGLEKVIANAVMGALDLGVALAESIIEGIKNINWDNVIANAWDLIKKAWEFTEKVFETKFKIVEVVWGAVSDLASWLFEAITGKEVEVDIKASLEEIGDSTTWKIIKWLIAPFPVKLTMAIALVKDGWDTLSSFIGIVKKGIGQKINRVKGWGKEKMSSFMEVAKKGISQTINRVKGWGMESMSKFLGIVSSISQTVNRVKGWGSQTMSTFIGKVADGISQTVNRVKGWGSQTMSTFIGKVADGISQTVNRAKGWGNTTMSSFIGIVSGGITQTINRKKGWTTSIKEWLGIDKAFTLSFKLPKIGIYWKTKKVGNFSITYPTDFYTYAKGGFPNTGEMFIANEKGPEAVGKLGRKNAVANKQQIAEGIASAVYPAVFNGMMAAFSQKGENQKQQINVYVGDKQVTDFFVDYVKDRTRATGVNPVMI